MRQPWIRAFALATAVLTTPIIVLGQVSTRPVSSDHVYADAAASTCTTSISRTVASDTIETCEQSRVQLNVRSHCPGDPLNVVLVLFGYAVGPGPALHRSFSKAAVDSLRMSESPNTKVGVVYLYRNGSILQKLTSDEDAVRSAIRVSFFDAFSTSPPYDGICYQCGFALAKKVLRDSTPGEKKVIVFIGAAGHDPDHPLHRDWLQGARSARSEADTFIVACPWVLSCKWSDWWREASPGYFFEGTSPGSFAIAVRGLAGPRSEIDSLQVDERVPVNLTYIDGSASPPPSFVDAPSGRLRWDFPAPITDSITITYRVQPLLPSPASYPVTTSFAAGLVALTDTAKLSSVFLIPTAALTITGPCETPSATPTDVPPTVPATATSLPPPPTSTLTPTALPADLYLPVALREDCRPERVRIDVALVLDASLSMLEPAGDGRTKLDAARAGALAFLDAVHLDAGDQAAVVAFNRDPSVLQGLTSDRLALSNALAAIAPAHGTRIDLGIAAAGGELLGEHRRPTNQAVMIVLTDGRADPVGPEAAVEAARLAKAAGVVVFTVGLGEDLDAEALEAMASRPAYYFASPDAAALAGIYREIAVMIPCPGELFWGRR